MQDNLLVKGRPSRPRVYASNNVVDINDFSVPGEYFGPLFVGSEMELLEVSYVTTTELTIVSSENYNVHSSKTSVPWMSENRMHVEKAVDLGPGLDLMGGIYNDSMCLIYK